MAINGSLNILNEQVSRPALTVKIMGACSEKAKSGFEKRENLITNNGFSIVRA